MSQDYVTSAIAVTLGLVGLYLARRAFHAGRQLVTSPAVWRVLEHKLYFDELYDALFYRPAVALANALRRRRRGARRRALARRDRLRHDPGRRRGRAGPVRAPSDVRARDRVRGRRPHRRLRGGALAMLTTALILLPIAGALRRRGHCRFRARRTAGLAFLVALAGGRRSGSSPSTRFDFDDGGLQLGTSREWVDEPRDLVLGRLLRLLALARGRRGRRLGGGDRLRGLGRSRPAARVLRAPCSSSSAPSSRRSPRRTCSSSTSRSRRC